MKRIVIWVLILQFATGHNLLAEVLRLPMLLDHYQTHREETPDLSFVGFLWLHYGNAQHERSDARHASLPLHCAHSMMAESTLPHPLQLEPMNTASACVLENNLLVADEFLRLVAPLSGVFRPPIA